MAKIEDYNHVLSVVIIAVVTLSEPQAIVRLLSTPIGLAVIILSLASITTDAPSLGLLALALIVTKKEYIESFDGETEAVKVLSDADMIRNDLFNECDMNSDGLFQVGQISNLSRIKSNLKLGDGCDPNPCSPSCVVKPNS